MINEILIAGLFAISNAIPNVSTGDYEYMNVVDFEYYNILTVNASDNLGNEGVVQASARLGMTLSYDNIFDYSLYINNIYVNARNFGDSNSYVNPQYTFDVPYKVNLDVDFFNMYLTCTWDDGVDVAFSLVNGDDTIYRDAVGSIILSGEYTAYSYGIRFATSGMKDVIDNYLTTMFGGSGYQTGYNIGYGRGYSVGYNQGKLDVSDFSIATLMYTIFNAPVAILGGALNFTIFGVNIKNLAFFLLTVGIVVWVYSVFKKG